jgi:hypothetical protein
MSRDPGAARTPPPPGGAGDARGHSRRTRPARAPRAPPAPRPWFARLRLYKGSRHAGAARAQPFAERLCLCVQAQRGGGAGPEQSSDEEVDRAEVGELVALDREVAGLGKQAPELVDGERRGEPLPSFTLANPDAEIRVAALVPGAGMDDLTERGDDELAGPAVLRGGGRRWRGRRGRGARTSARRWANRAPCAAR